MVLGPGRYDRECTQAREATQAQRCILIVIAGTRGSGFSVQAPVELTAVLPNLLNDMASEIRASLDTR